MSAFNFQQIKKMCSYFLKRLRPNSTDRGVVIQQRLAFAYAFVGWHGFMYVFYQMAKDKFPLDSEERKKSIIHMAQAEGKTVQFTQIKGFTAETKIIENDSNIVSSHE